MLIGLNDYTLAKSTAQLRLSVAHTTTSRHMLAKVQFQLHDYDALLPELADVQRTYESKMQAVHALEQSLAEHPQKP
jgi:hypothetical protein